VIEITESQQLPSSPIWGETARQLRELGVGLAIDDFGSGYSSMEKLLSMPFSHIKVDRVMTTGVGLTVAAKFAAAIAAMAAESGMVTIVEGIESEIELSTMVTAGCIYGQGYLFSRPVPLRDVLASLSHGEHSSIAHRHFPASA
jgi:EAL domain-containing protein (putative c-di-GMP-specific phosphodiesterase class I)